MPDQWLPGAHQDRGVNAGYRLGRCSPGRPLAHATVGTDSRGVGKRGYFNILVHRDASREGGCTQYAEWDAKTWHAYEPERSFGPGVEFERLVTGGLTDEGLSTFEYLTDNQIEWGKRILDFAESWGAPKNLYDGPRYQAGGHNGWVNHKDVDASRSDGLTRAEWNLLVAGSGEEFEMRSMLIHKPGEYVVYVYDPANGTKTRVANDQVLSGMKFLAPHTGLDANGPHNGAYEVNAAFLNGLVEIT